MQGKYISVDNYIATLSESGKEVAAQIRACVADLVPGANEAIKYNMPAFQLGGRSFLYFAVWKKHVGLYPIYCGDSTFEALVAPFRVKKDTVQFDLAQPLPLDVIEPIILAQSLLSRDMS